jgi:two-component sensor histidine kinase
VAISWGIRDNGENRRFHFSWRESGGPDVRMPEHRGFGSMLTEEIAARQFEGEISRAFDKDGFRYRLEAPLAAVAMQA